MRVALTKRQFESPLNRKQQGNLLSMIAGYTACALWLHRMRPCLGRKANYR